jgi:predicted glycoside hydrolase/deacetylase ChbG (UPF0249 family)
MSRIILTADDFGACDFIDNGIVRALHQKKINTVTAFVTHPDSESRVRSLVALREELKEENQGNYTFNIGLHFSLTSGTALTGRSSLTEEDSDQLREAKNYPFRKIALSDIHKELNAQLELLESWIDNGSIDHVSNHHGITYLDLMFFETYIHTINSFKEDKYKRNIPIRSPRSWIKSGMKTWKNGKILVPTVRQGIELGFWKKVFDLTGRKLKIREEHATELVIACPQFLADTIYGLPFTENIEFLFSQLNNPDHKAHSAEFMFHLVHPGHEVADLRKTIDELIMPHGIDRAYFPDRTKELEALYRLDINAQLQQNGLQRIFFTEL